MSEEVVGPGCRVGPLAFSGDTLLLGELLGTGATASVFACTRQRTAEELAVKVIDLSRFSRLDNPEEALRRLEVEVQAQREATHERCLGLVDIYRTKRWIFLVMERLRGGELFDQIINRRRFSEVEARYVFKQVVEGLAFLHSRRICHRDIKPENILVMGSKEAPPPEGGTLFDVKIADYGLSKLLTAGSVAKSMVGTPQYWAPEVLDSGGMNSYDQRADLWSLGVTLYVMLRGQYPFKGADTAEQIRKGQFDLAGGNWPQVSEEAKDLLRQLLKVNAAERLPLEGCLRHPWVTQRAPSLSSVGSPPQALEPLQILQESAGSAATGVAGAVRSAVSAAASGTAQSSTAVVRWQAEEPGCLRVGGDGSGNAFSFKELVQLQVSLVGSLEIAVLSCRYSHPQLASDIRQVLYKANALWQHALAVVKEYARVAREVRQRVLPDLELAVQEAEPSLAVDLLDMVQVWSEDMRKSGETAQKLCTDMSDHLQVVINKVHNEHADKTAPALGLGSAAAGGYPSQGQQALPAPPNAARAMETTPQAPGFRGSVRTAGREVNQSTQRLLDALATFTTTGGTGEADMIDLLFMAPGVERPRALMDGSVHSTNGSAVDKDSAMSDVGGTPRAEPAPSTATCSSVHPQEDVSMEQLQLVVARNQDQQNQGSLANPLLRALRELRRVSEILMECQAFWTNMSGTVKELSRFKEHTQSLLKYAAKNARLRERFATRLAEYSDFWGSLQGICDQYCMAVEPVLVKMRSVVRKIEDEADRMVDTTLDLPDQGMESTGVVQMFD